MRTQPIGTGPFKLVGFKPNEAIKVAKNPDYWKKNRPYLDGIEYTIIKNASTRVLAFIAGDENVSVRGSQINFADVVRVSFQGNYGSARRANLMPLLCWSSCGRSQTQSQNTHPL